MDTGNGKFELVNAENSKELLEKMLATESLFPKHGGWFQEGEEVELKGSRFRVKRIKPTEIVLKLLKRAE